MTNLIYTIPNLDDVLVALAVLEEANSKALVAFLDHELSEDDLADLTGHPAILKEKGRFMLAPDTASEYLKALERDDLVRFRHLHERGITLLANQLCGGDQATELALMAVFGRLANRLLTDDTERLMALVEEIQRLPLSVASWQKCEYFKAVSLRSAERYAESLAVHDRLLLEPDLDSWVHGRTLNSRAICYRLLGRVEDALADYRQSLTICQQAGHRLGEGLVRVNMATLAYDLQKYDEAEASLRQAEAIFEEIGSSQWLASVHNELGLIHRDRGHWPEALAYFEQYVAQRRAEGAHDRIGRGMNNIGEVLLFQGRLAEASVALQEALAKMNTRVYRIDTYLNLGLAYQVAGDLIQSRSAFQEAYALALEIGRRDFLPHIHYRLGDVLRRLGDDTAALAQFRAGAEVIEAMRTPLRDEELKISLLGRWQQVYEALVLHCLAIDRPAEAFEWAERSRARAFSDILLEKQVSATADETDDSQNVQSFAATAVTVGEVQARLPEDGVLFCYFTTGVLEQDIPLLKSITEDNPLRDYLLTPSRTLLFVVTRHSLTAHECPLDPNTLATVSPRGHDPIRLLEPTARQYLHKTLLGLASDGLTASVRYLIPHGPLHHVPFAALMSHDDDASPQADNPYLVYAPNATLLVKREVSADGPEQTCLTIGYNSLQEGQVLRYSEREAELVAGLTGGQAWVGPEPKKERLPQMAVKQRWLHIACHGWFNNEQPLASYLETGLGEQITALEIMQDWHLRAELVVLSACQTGVSQILRGDEPLGLIRAFLIAGAKTVLVSRWIVEDLPTFLLMYHFYQTLSREAKSSATVALHQAQRWLRHLTIGQVQDLLVSLTLDSQTIHSGYQPPTSSADTTPFAHPRHWAAFTVVGS